MSYNAIILTDTLDNERIKPLGAYLISNILRNNNFNTIVIDYFSKIQFEDLEIILKKYISSDTLLVGYSSSLFLMSKDSLLKDQSLGTLNIKKINNLIKDINPNLKILIGGACSKSIWNYNLEKKDNLGFDYVMHGYSETMILEFIKSLKNKQTPKFNNFYNKLYEIDYDYKGETYDFHNSLHFWHESDFIRQKETLPLEIARGCVFKCKFCAYPLLGKNPNDDSYYKKEELLLTEILNNYEKYKTLNYFIIDDTFNEKNSKIELMLRVRDKSKLDLNFVGFNRIELLARKQEQIHLLKDLNFTGHFFGIENFNYETLKIIGKGIKLNEIRDTIYKMKTMFNDRISIGISLILGLPLDTPQLFEQNTKWLLEPNNAVDNVFFNPLFLTYTTHTTSDFFNNPKQYGYTFLENGSWKSDHWTQETAIEQSKIYYDKFSKIQKISAFKSIILAGYGYDYFKLIKIPANASNSNRINQIHKKYLKEYVNNLKNYQTDLHSSKHVV